MAIWIIAAVTWRELVRRKLVLALLTLTAIVLGFTGWGFSRVPGLDLAGHPLSQGEIQTASAQFLLLVMFMFSFVLALTCAFLAAPAVAGDIESGVAQGLLSRPLRRTELILGRWIGLALPITVYTVASSTLEFELVRWTTGYWPPQPIAAEAALLVEGLVLLTLTLAMSTRISAITAGVIAVIVFGTMWLGGVAGGFGQVFHNAAITNVGVATHLLVPTDGLWRAAVFAMEPSSFAAEAAHGLNSSFESSSGPTVAYLAWVAAWLAVVLALAAVSFQRREA
jgi:ABC-type transport system involved in multi-copper enzyme maturation permease subunit